MLTPPNGSAVRRFTCMLSRLRSTCSHFAAPVRCRKLPGWVLWTMSREVVRWTLCSASLTVDDTSSDACEIQRMPCVAPLVTTALEYSAAADPASTRKPVRLNKCHSIQAAMGEIVQKCCTCCGEAGCLCRCMLPEVADSHSCDGGCRGAARGGGPGGQGCKLLLRLHACVVEHRPCMLCLQLT